MNIKIVVEEKKVIKNNFFAFLFIQYFIMKLGFLFIFDSSIIKEIMLDIKNYYKKYETFVQYQGNGFD